MRLRRIGAALFALLVLAALAATPATAARRSEPAAAPDRLLVTYERGTSAAERGAARARVAARGFDVVVQGARDRLRVEAVKLPPGTNRAAAQRRLAADANVAFAEPDYKVTPVETSNETYYTDGSLWGMYGDATSPANQHGSQAGEAWASGNTGNDAVYVGIIDTGVDVNHADLRGNMWTNPFDGADGVDNDGNGYVDDVHGWDFYYNNNTVYDSAKSDSHGTHVAGTIGAVGGNAAGVAGVAWNVTMISGKFLGPRGGYTSDAIRAVDYFTDLKARHGLNIVATNNSWGGGGFSQNLHNAIQRANNAGILFMAAAGNSNVDTDDSPHYPSSYDNANIVSVASITSTGARSSFSNYGKTSVDLGAPGSSILSTIPDGGYGYKSGTSMATPHVTGAAVLYAAANPGSSGATVRNAILNSVVPTASMAGVTVTGGRLDVSTFTGSGGVDDGGTTPPPNQAPTATFTFGCTDLSCDFDGRGSTDDTGVTEYSWDFGDQTAGSGPTPSHTYASEGTYTVILTVRDAEGLFDTESNSVTVTAPALPGDGFTLTATPYKLKGVQHAELTWSGATTETVDIERDGTVVGTVPNSSPYHDDIGRKGGGSYSYRVCEAGTETTCSNTAVATF